MLKNIRNYFLILSALSFTTCATRQNTLFPKFESCYLEKADETRIQGSSSYIFHIRNFHFSDGFELLFPKVMSKKEYDMLEEKRKKVNENTVFLIKDLIGKYHLKIVGIEPFWGKELNLEGILKNQSEIPRKELEDVLSKNNYNLPVSLERIFGDKITTIGISDIALNEEVLRLNKQIAEKASKLIDLGMVTYDKNTGLLRENVGSDSLDKNLFDLLKDYREFNELRKEYRYKRSEVAVSILIKKMKEEGETVAILIMGGWHTEDIKELLREKGISCYVFEPSGYNNKKLKLK